MSSSSAGRSANGGIPPVDRVVDPFIRVPKAILDHKPELVTQE
jgi:hypothetical protein